VLERNPQYWKPNLPYLDRIVFQVVPDQSTRVAVMEKGDADLSHLSAIPFHEAQRMGKLPHLALTTKGYEAFSGVAHVEVNVRKPPLNNVKVRQALAHALDKEFVRQTIWFGFGRIATGPINSNLKEFYNPNVPRHDYDQRKAEQLLDDAGFRRGPGGTRFSLNVTYNPFRDEYARLAEYVRTQLDRIGIAVRVQTYDNATWLSKMFTQWDFDLDANLLNNFPDPSSGVERGYTTKGTQKGVPFANSMGYSNPVVDELFARAAVEPNARKRRELYHQAQEILVREVPALWLLEIEWVTVMSRDLENVVTSPWGLYDSYDEVYFKKSRP
jgi:peptide/nickel transport system substrate-binding protein